MSDKLFTVVIYLFFIGRVYYFNQRFIDITVPQADHLGLVIPDPDLKWNEAEGHYEFGEIDWDEFWAVVKGGGPCRRQRIKTRVDAHEKGQWVREAATAYARKRASRQEAA